MGGAVKKAVVTTFSPKGYELYGRRMIDTFAEFWPEDVELFIYYEGQKPEDASERAQWISLDDDKARAAFVATHEDGISPEDLKNWNYRLATVTFCHKVFAMTSVKHDGMLIWLDGDTETVHPITHEYLEELLPPGYICSYLGRPDRHSETGFLAFDTADKWGRNFLYDFRQVYISDDIMKLAETHDAYVFDFMRRKYQHAGFKFLSLSQGMKGLNAFSHSPLFGFIDHHKGPIGKYEAYGASA